MIDAPGLQVRDGGAGRPERRVEVGVEDPLDLVGRGLLEAVAVLLVRGVEHQHVEPAELVDDPLHELLALLLGAHVAGQLQRPLLRLVDPGCGVGGILLLLGEVRDRDVGALAREGDRDRPPDAGVAAGDQRPHPVEPAGADVAGLAVIGDRDRSSR